LKTEHFSIHSLWKRYLHSLGETPESTSKQYSAWHFCATQEAADELAQLVLSGTKRATTSSLWSIEAEGESIPMEGEISIITNWKGEAQCIIKTTAVEVMPYRDVPPEFAASEGEGDKSLQYWRRVHKEVFTQELKELGFVFSEDMPVVCETFEVVWPQ